MNCLIAAKDNPDIESLYGFQIVIWYFITYYVWMCFYEKNYSYIKIYSSVNRETDF